MNTPTDPFEEELRALQPVQPSVRLAGRIATELAATAAPTAHRTPMARLRPLSLWLPWGVAAAMTVAFFTRTPPPPATGDMPASSTPAVAATTEASGRFMPVGTTKTLIGALDEGVVFLEDGSPARKVRYEFLDTVDLRSIDDPHATLAVTTPREEIRLVPVQTY